MISKEIREIISEDHGFEDAIMFDNPSFDNSVVGVTFDGSVVYDYNKMVVEMADEDDIAPEDAEDFIQYNTIRALPYMPEPRPIVMIPIDEDRE